MANFLLDKKRMYSGATGDVSGLAKSLLLLFGSCLPAAVRSDCG